MLARWNSIVLGERNSAVAASLLLAPPATTRATCSSWGVSWSRFGGARWRADPARWWHAGWRAAGRGSVPHRLLLCQPKVASGVGGAARRAARRAQTAAFAWESRHGLRAGRDERKSSISGACHQRGGLRLCAEVCSRTARAATPAVERLRRLSLDGRWCAAAGRLSVGSVG